MQFNYKYFNVITNNSFFKFNSISNAFTKFLYHDLNKTSLFLAIENDNNEIAKLLLSNDKINPNIICILIFFLFTKF